MPKIAAGAPRDARRAVDAADGAFGAWSQALPPERQRVFLAATDILERRSDEVVGLLARRPAHFGAAAGDARGAFCGREGTCADPRPPRCGSRRRGQPPVAPTLN